MTQKIKQFRFGFKKKGPIPIRAVPYCKASFDCVWKRRKSHHKQSYCAMFPDSCNQQAWGG